MGITVQLSDCDWRQHLHELVIEVELRITEAEHRIENHHKLWPLSVEGEAACARAHLELERTLIESLKLLHMWRSMVLHELRGASLPRSAAVPGPWSEPAASNRQAHLAGVIAWLDHLPATTVSKIVSEQRDRAFRELWQIQKRQLWERNNTADPDA